jgi:hypothetical protein
MSPMFLTRMAKPPKVSTVFVDTEVAMEAEARKDCPRPSGFSTAVRFAGSKAMEFGAMERETKSAPSY